LFLLSAAPAGVRADEALPDAATIRQKVTAAAAVPRAYRRTTVTTSSNGATITSRYIRRGEDWREIVERGPFRTESGSVKDELWHQNDNGQTILDEPDPGNAKPDPVTTTVTRVHVPDEAYVVAELNARGHGTKRFVDPSTWRVVRRETVTANGTIVTVYDDFRDDGGRVFAHHWKDVDGYTRTTRETRVTEYDPSDVSESEVGKPASRRQLVDFPAGVRSTVLPARFTQRHVVVRVTINGRGLDFMLDTGASGLAIDSDVARQLGLPAYEQRSAVTAGRYTTARTIVPEMHVGELVMKNVAVQMLPNAFEMDPGVKAVGLLGFDFLAELGVTIDYEHERVTAVSEPDYTPPSGSAVIALDVRIGDGSPLASVRINGALSERFTLDTGGGGTLLIFDAFARKHPEALVDKRGGSGRDMIFNGIGGVIETRPYQLSNVQLGPINFQDFVGYRVMNARSYDGDDDGVIGTDFLRLFTLGLDYANSRVYLVPNRDGRAAMGLK
jgi:clan AA aspartic protease (TIGR02281 family)